MLDEEFGLALRNDVDRHARTCQMRLGFAGHRRQGRSRRRRQPARAQLGVEVGAGRGAADAARRMRWFSCAAELAGGVGDSPHDSTTRIFPHPERSDTRLEGVEIVARRESRRRGRRAQRGLRRRLERRPRPAGPARAPHGELGGASARITSTSITRVRADRLACDVAVPSRRFGRRRRAATHRLQISSVDASGNVGRRRYLCGLGETLTVRVWRGKAQGASAQ